MPHLSLGVWDWLLLVVVTTMSLMVAYLHHPKWKAFIISLPIPFSLATMSLAASNQGHGVDATNVVGLLLLLGYFHGARLLHRTCGVPIVASIVVAAAGYCVAGMSLAGVLPTTDVAFWTACIGIGLVGVVCYLVLPYRIEPGHRTPLPVYIKLPIIATLIFFLILIKGRLRGFLTVFPMVSVIATYEARHSLWTMSRQISVLMLAMVPMMITCRLAQGPLGVGPALLVAWVVYLAIFLPLDRTMHRPAAAVAADE